MAVEMSKTMLVDARVGLRWTSAHSHKTAMLAPFTSSAVLAAALVVTVAVCNIGGRGEPHEQPAKGSTVGTHRRAQVVTGDRP
jgi:hypothetical protein